MFTVTYQDSRSASGIGTSIVSDVAAFAEMFGMRLLSVKPTDNPARFVVNGNCLYGGNAIGHSDGFCTADSCY
jgi:hypothetical protein